MRDCSPTSLEIDAIIGANLRRLREDLCLEGRTLATRLGVDPRRLAAVEAGTARLSMDTLHEAATMLGCPLQALFRDPPKARLPS